MSLTTVTRGYKGRGKLLLRRLSGGMPFYLGNVVSVNESIEVERSARQNYQTAAGGELDVEEVISSYAFEAVVDDITPDNIALGFQGTSEELASQAVTDEILHVWSGFAHSLKYIPDPTVAPTVEIYDGGATHATTTAFAQGETMLEGGRVYMAVVGGTTDASPPSFPTNLGTVVDGTVTWKDLGDPALVADTDYEVTAHGIRMLATQAARFYQELSIPLKVDYTRNAQYLIQALVASGDEFYVEFLGLNSVDGGNPVIGRYRRAKFSPTSGFPRLGGDDFAQITLSGSLLADQSITAQGESQYAEFAMV